MSANVQAIYMKESRLAQHELPSYPTALQVLGKKQS